MKKNLFKGISFTVGASLWWGIIGVIYFKFVSYASPLELTIHRTIWTALLLILTTFYSSKWKEFNKIIDSFRPDHIWEKRSGKWQLKNAVWK